MPWRLDQINWMLRSILIMVKPPSLLFFFFFFWFTTKRRPKKNYWPTYRVAKPFWFHITFSAVIFSCWVLRLIFLHRSLLWLLISLRLLHFPTLKHWITSIKNNKIFLRFTLKNSLLTRWSNVANPPSLLFVVDLCKGVNWLLSTLKQQWIESLKTWQLKVKSSLRSCPWGLHLRT